MKVLKLQSFQSCIYSFTAYIMDVLVDDFTRLMTKRQFTSNKVTMVTASYNTPSYGTMIWPHVLNTIYYNGSLFKDSFTDYHHEISENF